MNKQLDNLAERVFEACRNRDYNLATFITKNLNTEDKYYVDMKAKELAQQMRDANPR